MWQVLYKISDLYFGLGIFPTKWGIMKTELERRSGNNDDNNKL